MKVIPIIMLASLKLSLGRIFVVLLDCFGRRGCPLDYASSSIPYFRDSPVWSNVGKKEGIPPEAVCAYLCHRDDTCLSFRYDWRSDTCNLYSKRPFKIWNLDGCISFEVNQTEVSSNETAKQNLAENRRTCQSSAAVINGQIQAAWNLVDGKLQDDVDSYAMTSDSDKRGWWEIDLERVVNVTYIRLITRNVTIVSSFPRLLNLTVEISNTSMAEHDPPIDNVCAVVRRRSVNPGMVLSGTCHQSLLPGRYFILREHPTTSNKEEQFSLAEVHIFGI